MEVRIGKLIAGLTGTLVLALTATAHGSQLIGQTGTNAGSCTNDEAYVQKTLTSGPGYSPSAYGVITSWQAAGDPDPAQTLVLMVLRPDSASQFSNVGNDVVRTLAPNTLNTFTGLRLPIEASQRIAVYQPPGSHASCDFPSGNSSDADGYSVPYNVGIPPIGQPFDYSGSDDGYRVNAQAVVEPDTDRDVFGDETQDKCVGTAGTANGCPSTVAISKLKQKGDTKVRATVTVPGAGRLQVKSAGKATKSVTKNLTATAVQHLKLTLKLTRSAINQLQTNGTLKLKLKAVYTPPGGSPGSATAKKKLS
jgi:hypothetical protein